MIRVVRALAVGALATLLASPATGAAQEPLGIKLGAKAPGAVVQTLDGKPLDLGTFIGKQPVLLEFWATWCGNCRELEPQMDAVVKKYGSRVKFVAVAVSVNQSPERAKAYAEKHSFMHQVVYDKDGQATDAYDAPATSYIVVIDKAGKVVYTGLGGEQNLDEAVKKGL